MTKRHIDFRRLRDLLRLHLWQALYVEAAQDGCWFMPRSQPLHHFRRLP